MFENDGNLGGGNSRPVVIELRGYTPQYSIYYTAESVLIKDTLQRAGWNVSLVVETSGGFAGYGQRTWKIYAKVLNQYSDVEIPAYVRSDLGDVMTVVDARVLKESPTPSNPEGYASSDNPSGNDPITYLVNQANAAVKDAAGAASSNVLYYLAGGLLLVVLIARR